MGSTGERRNDGPMRGCGLVFAAAAGPWLAARRINVVLFTALVLALSATPAHASELDASLFGISNFTAEAVNVDGTLDTQAGSHPYEATTSFTLNHRMVEGVPEPYGNLKDLEVDLPAGFIGNPQATPQCPVYEFDETGNAYRLPNPTEEPSSLVVPPCPIESQVGTATVQLRGALSGDQPINKTYTVPVFNLVPSFGHPAEFGFEVEIFGRVRLVASVRTATDYGVNISVAHVPTSNGGATAELSASAVTFWGVPADPSHNAQRGEACFGEGCSTASPPCLEKSEASCSLGGNKESDAARIPFLTNPTDCQSGSPVTTLKVDSYQDPGVWKTATAISPQPTGCSELSFSPSLDATPESSQADAPSGYTVDLKVPQDESPGGLGTPELDNVSVTLPRGVSIDPSAANGLAGCTNEQIAIGTENPVACPSASKIGAVEIKTPLLAEPLTGSLYLGTPLEGNPYRIFLYAVGPDFTIRLEGTVSADPTTGQLTATFKQNPQLPFNELIVKLYGGSRAPLANPLTCGPASTTSLLTPYGAPEASAATPASTFGVDGNGVGAFCPTSWPFTPSLTAGTRSPSAGAYSPFVFEISRSDRQQYISQVGTVSLPPGLLGNISAVPLCGSVQAAAGSCASLSQIGEITVGAGPGAEPFYLPGKVYLTQSYDGDPFGLAIVVPALAGPYNLGTVVVRAGVQINSDGSVTVKADPVPTILQGIPLRLRSIDLTIDRPGFMLNPTNCAAQSITASVSSQQGSTATVGDPFYATGCAGLPFSPILEASSQAHTSKADGAALAVRIAQRAGEANIHRVDVQLPLALPSRLTTLQKACSEAQFQANPAGCPEGSDVGMATATTPLLRVPLSGPAYLVSHGGAAFPDLDLVLQGEGVTIELVGNTVIKKGITYSRFETVPDAPITSFELHLPEGPHSVLAAGGSLCAKRLTMPTTIEGQNGAKVSETKLITVTGCPRAAKKATLQINKTSVNPRKGAIAVSVRTSVNGTVRVSGLGIKTITRKNLAAGSHEIKVALTNGGKAAARHRGKTGLRVSLTVGTQAVAKTTSVKL
jgi:hypothetical protein